MSDSPWPAEAAAAIAVLESATGRKLGDTAVDIDVSDEAQFDAFLALLPYTINAEGWASGPGRQSLDHAGAPILAVSDTGSGVVCAPDRRERGELARDLDQHNLAFEFIFLLGPHGAPL